MTTFTETLPTPLEPGTNFCANASKVGVVRIKTPDLPNELEGGVYTAAQNANPFGSLFAIYIVAQDPVSKVLVKLAGEVKLNSSTGQITTTFANTPDLPFEELTLELFGGPGATLTTPQGCGAAPPTRATFTSWANEPGEAPLTVTREAGGFDNSSGAEGSGCPGSQPFAPSFQAGMANTQAGAYSPFELTINHPDADQPLTGLTTTLPPGLAAVIASVTPCGEPAASQGTCGPESLIGKAEASVGLGGEPFTQKEGRVYLTGPYEGAPFGLSVVVPTKAGPFDFGNVVTRSTINVNEETAAVTINSPLPTFVNTTTYPGGVGVPAQLKSLHVVVDREHFQFNPTNCSPMAITGTLTGASGGSESVSSPFHAENCQSLAFAPKFTASVAAQGSKANGTAFNVTVESGGIGVEGIRKVFLTIPKILPARLQPTLQNACLDKVFTVNPAGCPEDAFIGRATVYTPVLKTPLTGPAILVSHGNASFPDVEFVLQSENIHILLDGKTDIKKGVTYSRFESAPDAPFTKFVTELPAGPHSIFTDNTEEAKTYNLCGKTIVAPTEITAQDGELVKQETKVTVTGCGPVQPTVRDEGAEAGESAEGVQEGQEEEEAARVRTCGEKEIRLESRHEARPEESREEDPEEEALAMGWLSRRRAARAPQPSLAHDRRAPCSRRGVGRVRSHGRPRRRRCPSRSMPSSSRAGSCTTAKAASRSGRAWRSPRTAAQPWWARRAPKRALAPRGCSRAPATGGSSRLGSAAAGRAAPGSSGRASRCRLTAARYWSVLHTARVPWAACGCSPAPEGAGASRGRS